MDTPEVYNTGIPSLDEHLRDRDLQSILMDPSYPLDDGDVTTGALSDERLAEGDEFKVNRRVLWNVPVDPSEWSRDGRPG